MVKEWWNGKTVVVKEYVSVKQKYVVKEADGSFSRPHRVNPETGQYRGKQVLDIEV